MNRKSEEGRTVHICNLDKIILQMSANSKMAVIVLDVSIKNQAAASIAYIHIHNSPIIKTLYHVVNVTFKLLGVTSIKPISQH